MATFHLLNFGCRSSQADGAALKEQLLEAGFDETATLEETEFAILNTCTVTAAADREVRQFVRRIQRRNPRCRILVTGCYAQRAPEEIASLGGVAWVVGNSHKHLVKALLAPPGAAVQRGRSESDDQVIGVTPAQGLRSARGRSGAPEESDHPSAGLPGQPLAQFYGKTDTALVQIQTGPSQQASGLELRATDPTQVLVGEIAEEFHFAPVFPYDRTRPTLKLQDGCNARCSFCVIPFVRGRSRSLDPEKVLTEARRLQQAGFQELVLSGINLGAYGRDLNRRITFLEILERLLAETSLPRLRISSLELMDVSAPLVDLVAQEPRLAKHFHVPLQSGCDRILRLMNRRYWSRQYAERILAIHERIPNCGIGADVMVGFPGETARDHATSLQFIEALPFTYLHIFTFSPRPGTPAAATPAQVIGRVARERSRDIRALMASKRRRFLAVQVGRTLPSLTLGAAEAGSRVALTTNYLEVNLSGSELRPNRLVDVHVDRASSGQLFGHPQPATGGQPAVGGGHPITTPLGATAELAAVTSADLGG